MNERWKTVMLTLAVIVAIGLIVLFYYAQWWVGNRMPCNEFDSSDKIPARCVELRK